MMCIIKFVKLCILNYGKIAIMYPMITSIKEIRRIKEIVSKVKAELKAEGIPRRTDG